MSEMIEEGLEPTAAPEAAPVAPVHVSVDESQDNDALWGDLVGFDQPVIPAAQAEAAPLPAEIAPVAPAPAPVVQDVSAQPQAAPIPAGQQPPMEQADANVVPIAVAPQPQQQQQPAQAPATQPQQVAPQAQPVQQAAQTAQQPPAQPLLTPQEQLKNWEEQIVPTYAPSEKDSEDLTEGMSNYLPRLAAQVHTRAVQEAVQVVMGQVPGLIQGTVDKMRTGAQNEATFYKRWPQLRDPAYATTVQTLGYGYRQMYPQASMQDFISHVGAQAMIASGLQVTGQPPAQQPQTVSTVPGQPQQGVPNPREFQVAFQPAGAGTGAPGPAPMPAQAGQQDFWGNMADDIKAGGWW